MGVGLIVTIAILLIIAAVIWAIYHLYKPEERPRDDTLVDFVCTQFTRGYSQGILKEIIHGTKRMGVVFYPKDEDNMELVQDEETNELKEITFWINEEKLRWLPRGRWSRRRNRLLVLAPELKYIPNALQDIYGPIVMKENKNIDEKNMLEEELKGARGFLKSQTSWENQREEVKRLKELYEDVFKTKGKKEESSSPVGASSPRF